MKFQTRTIVVDAIQFNGDVTELEVFIKEHTGRDVELGLVGLAESAWVVCVNGGWQMLPDSVFQRVYEPAASDPHQFTFKEKTCFVCAHYRDSYCTVFDEVIHSELRAAQDCEAFDLEGTDV